MIVLTTDEQALVRFKVDSRVTEKDLPTPILNQLAVEAEADLKMRLSTLYSSLPVASQALYRSAVMNLTAAFGVASVRPQVQQRAGPVAVQWADEEREKKAQAFRALYESNVDDLIDPGTAATRPVMRGRYHLRDCIRNAFEVTDLSKKTKVNSGKIS